MNQHIKGSNKDFEPGTSVTSIHGIYRGLVLDNRDPGFHETQDKKIYGRVKVWIPELMEYDPKDPYFGIYAWPANAHGGGRNFRLGTLDDRNKTNKNRIHDDIDKNGKRTPSDKKPEEVDENQEPYNTPDKQPQRIQEYWGSFTPPVVGSYVFIFFEGGNPSRPFYFGACDIKEQQVPPENRVKTDQEWEHRWLIIRTPKGRVIIASDDPEDCRVEITGVKRKTPSNYDKDEDHIKKDDKGKPIDDPKQELEDYVFNIDKEEKRTNGPDEGNMKSILIDERRGKEKILMKDERGNFINLRSNLDRIDMFCHKDMHIEVGQDMFINVHRDMHTFVERDKFTYVENDNHTVIDNDNWLHVKNNMDTKVEKDYKLFVGNTSHEFAGSEIRKTSNDQYSIKSLTSLVAIDAPASIVDEQNGSAINAMIANPATKATEAKPDGRRDS